MTLLVSMICQAPLYAQSRLEADLEAVDEFSAEADSLATEESEKDSAASSGKVAEELSIVQKPRWEVGVGAGFFKTFDYPASRESDNRALALPFFIYRTQLVRFGDGGVRAVAIENPRVKLDLSIGGSLNASSDGNTVREGLPDLDFLFEVGPQLEVRLFEHRLASGARVSGRFTSELRAVFSTDFGSVDSRGYVAEIGLGMSVSNIANTGISFFSGFDVSFATERLQDYFYEVEPEFVTDTRPAFDARGGYLESNLFLGLGFSPLRRVRVFTGVIQGFFDGASNQGSPLFEVTQQTRFALGIVWTIKTSKQTVDVVDLGDGN